jgi:hypothetical protein
MLPAPERPRDGRDRQLAAEPRNCPPTRPGTAALTMFALASSRSATSRSSAKSSTPRTAGCTVGSEGESFPRALPTFVANAGS